MPLVPPGRLQKVVYFETHVPVWQAHAAALQLPGPLLAALADEVTAARAAFLAHEEAQNAARAATQQYYHAVRALQETGADALRTIKNTAEIANDPNIYVLGNLPVPRPRSATPPPGTPTGFAARLLPIGALQLTWQCRNPRGTAGTMYEVWRRVEGSGFGVQGSAFGGEGSGNASDMARGGGEVAGRFEYLGSCGVKVFIDETLPVGAGRVTYQIVATRSTRRGRAARFLVNLGVGSAEVAALDLPGQSSLSPGAAAQGGTGRFFPARTPRGAGRTPATVRG